MKNFFLTALIALTVFVPVHAQTVGLSLGSASAAAGSSVPLTLSMTAAGGAQPVAAEWSFTYSTTDVASLTVSATAAATNAGKTLLCANGAAGTMMCLLYGINATVIPNGAIAQVQVSLSPATTSASTAIQAGGVSAASTSGGGIPMTATAGTIAITAPTPVLAGVTCTPSTVTATGALSCAVSLSGAALTGGMPVGLASSGAQLTVPASVMVPAGAATKTFTAMATAVTPAMLTVTASANSVSKTASITFGLQQVSTLVCTPAAVVSGSSVNCTVTLVEAAPQGSGLAVTLSSNNSAIKVPATVTVAGGAASATFAAQAGGTAIEQVWLTASLNSTSSQAMITVSAFQIQGVPSELSGWSNGAAVAPSSGPAAFNGAYVVTGTGAANFAPVGAVDGVAFTNCCTNVNTAYYKFMGTEIGNIFNQAQGQISFNLKSNYSFAQRQTTAAAPRYTFDVQDNVSTRHHQFYFLTEYTQNALVFSFMAGGTTDFFYFVPAGTENALFGSGVELQVTLSWSNGMANLYLNGNLVLSKANPVAAPAAWTAASVFDLGATEYLTFGGYNTSDDRISEFTVGVPVQQ